jgi:putative flippase GtrA
MLTDHNIRFLSVSRQEFSIFIVIGMFAALADFIIYRGLIFLGFAGVNMAKTVGFLVATSLAYHANGSWTFGGKLHVKGSMWKFILLYATTLAINVYANLFFLKQIKEASMAMQLSFFLATGVSAILNFIGMKFFVFKDRKIWEPT